jgi:hypothetical protein
MGVAVSSLEADGSNAAHVGWNLQPLPFEAIA